MMPIVTSIERPCRKCGSLKALSGLEGLAAASNSKWLPICQQCATEEEERKKGIEAMTARIRSVLACNPVGLESPDLLDMCRAGDERQTFDLALRDMLEAGELICDGVRFTLPTHRDDPEDEAADAVAAFDLHWRRWMSSGASPAELPLVAFNAEVAKLRLLRVIASSLAALARREEGE